MSRGIARGILLRHEIASSPTQRRTRVRFTCWLSFSGTDRSCATTGSSASRRVTCRQRVVLSLGVIGLPTRSGIIPSGPTRDPSKRSKIRRPGRPLSAGATRTLLPPVRYWTPTSHAESLQRPNSCISKRMHVLLHTLSRFWAIRSLPDVAPRHENADTRRRRDNKIGKFSAVQISGGKNLVPVTPVQTQDGND